MIDIRNNGEADEEIPNGTAPLENQVAGHRFGHCTNRLGLLRHKTSRDILKPICDTRSERESQFYSFIWNEDNDSDQLIAQLRHFVAKHNGVLTDPKSGKNFLRLRDLTIGFENPSILDIKIGPKTYDKDANEEKIRSERNKYLYAQQIGFRILGMRIYNEITKEYIIKDKDYGIKLTPDNINEAIILFVQNNKALIKQYCHQIKAIHDWFQNNNLDKWQFISSSLLLVHDCNQSKAIVKMIDFAHVFTNKGRDDNYLFGLKKLIQYFDNI